MLLLTSEYYCTYSPRKLRHLACLGTTFCLPSSKKFAAKPFIQFCRTSLPLGHSSDSGRSKFSWNGENGNRLFPEFLHSVFFFNIRGQRQMPTSFLVMPISPAYFEQPTSFPHIALVDCTFRIQLNNLPVKFRQTKRLAFKNRTTASHHR
jgi:hypothetical protein